MMPLSKTRLLIRADGGPRIGTGHVMRMLALGQAYKKRGGEVTFVIGDLPRSLVKRLEIERFQIFRVRNDQGNQADAIDTREIAALVRPQWIALDGYRFDDAYEAWLARAEAQLMVMDDCQHADHRHADLIVNQNLNADASFYRESGAKVIAGHEYVLMRNEFAPSPSRRSFPSLARRVLVTFGGADPDNWTLKTLQILSDLKQKKLVVDCVVGSCYEGFRELEDFKRNAQMTLRIHRNVDRMAPLMQRADLAITAGGSTCYELARMGVPSIVTSIADNQEPIASAMNEFGAMQSIDHAIANSSNRGRNLVQLIRKLVNDPDLRKTLSETASRLVDGRGALRVVDRMAGCLLSLRQAAENDAKILWQWRNDPEVRAVSFSSDVIDFQTHQQWYSRQLSDSTSKIWIAENQKKEPVGNVRFDFDAASQRATMSIIVDPKMRGRGFGSALIHASISRLFATTSAREVLAQVKTGNTASEKAFHHAGFKLIEPTVIKSKMAQQFLLIREPYQWRQPAKQSAA